MESRYVVMLQSEEFKIIQANDKDQDPKLFEGFNGSKDMLGGHGTLGNRFGKLWGV